MSLPTIQNGSRNRDKAYYITKQQESCLACQPLNLNVNEIEIALSNVEIAVSEIEIALSKLKLAWVKEIAVRKLKLPLHL